MMSRNSQIIRHNTYLIVSCMFFAENHGVFQCFGGMEETFILLVQIRSLNVAFSCLIHFPCNTETLRWKFLLLLVTCSHGRCILLGKAKWYTISIIVWGIFHKSHYRSTCYAVGICGKNIIILIGVRFMIVSSIFSVQVPSTSRHINNV